MTSSLLDYMCKDPIFKYSPIHSIVPGVKTSMHLLEGGHSSTHNSNLILEVTFHHFSIINFLEVSQQVQTTPKKQGLHMGMDVRK